MEYELQEYLEDGKSPFAKWFNKLAPVTAARIDKYLRRMEQGNFGDSRSVGEGVQELKIDYGPGYRVYYGRQGEKLIILLGGGDKGDQSRRIAEAKKRWKRYQEQGG
jgi:putative addiction module killer protein